MKGPARSGAPSRRGSQVPEGGVEIAGRERGARGVLMQHVREHVELDRLQRDLVRGVELSDLELRQIELPKEHRLRGAVEARARREPLPRVASAHRGRTRGHRFSQ